MARGKWKGLWIGLVLLWLILMTVDQLFGIAWPNATFRQGFIWGPSVAVGVYWVIFGGKPKSGKDTS